MALSRKDRRLRIKRRIRKVVKGTNEQPRLSVYRSNKEIYAQIINDLSGTTLVAASSRDKDVKAKGTKVEVATIVGKAIAEKAVKAGITNIAFDRNGYLYHGRVKALADAAREAGLKF
ncbi:MAG: 50S ribosomal protein L18 [Flavobacteriales bacterium CG18_big_fil_WC_8_21_14_2_50_32_9]|jgi:large subunit ribosomal protein L18|nr:50S ribosomal protein L18 [Vicingaceae bacterium]NCP46452.1 50S ribosomal protein L18 [Flavobacteriales bacterium]PIQ14609.1 MAG: 50S ribosomal protein L18 [Flavobacteriales bacterium CG18_big_fil_WC_8_21_14_2_50_32_9]PIZ05695.1 MAG: 50S ribosomal protein L18 [Flavobacteriales bacterium CG_4_10_14_0_8_um_filter_32_5]PJC62518.1 MAG: 50S ribosomal protein L18 [Flavobacteriales bacterium CG_4_9_14_0_2_um_filter_32_27]